MVHRARPGDVPAVFTAGVVAVKVEDVIVAAPHLVAEAREPRDRERAVGEFRDGDGVAEKFELSPPRV